MASTKGLRERCEPAPTEDLQQFWGLCAREPRSFRNSQSNHEFRRDVRPCRGQPGWPELPLWQAGRRPRAGETQTTVDLGKISAGTRSTVHAKIAATASATATMTFDALTRGVSE